MDQATDFYFDALSQVHLDGWSRGRVGLVGDAAYGASPASGRARASRWSARTSWPASWPATNAPAFAAYEQKMREFVRRNQALGPANVKRMVMRTDRQVRTSMRMLSIMGKLPGRDRMLSAVMAPLHKAANAIDLPDYRS